MMKFLQESTDTPHTKGVKKEYLPLPNPGIDEYRRYFMEQTITQTTYEDNGEGNYTPKEQKVNTARFVSMQSDHEPTDEDWKQVLSGAGYTDEMIKAVLEDA